MAIFYWDFDGTIVHSEHLWSGTVYRCLKEFIPDTKIEFQEIRRYMAVGFTWHTPFNDYTGIKGEKWWDFMLDKIKNDYISMGVDNHKATKAASLIRNEIKKKENYMLYPDSISTLKALKDNGHKNIILSNNFPDLKDVIDALEISNLFDSYVISAIEGYDKPRQELFKIAQGFNNDNQPEYMIGDNIYADILGGKSAGMKTVYVHNGFCHEADYCFDELNGILNII